MLNKAVLLCGGISAGAKGTFTLSHPGGEFDSAQCQLEKLINYPNWIEGAVEILASFSVPKGKSVAVDVTGLRVGDAFRVICEGNLSVVSLYSLIDTGGGTPILEITGDPFSAKYQTYTY